MIDSVKEKMANYIEKRLSKDKNVISNMYIPEYNVCTGEFFSSTDSHFFKIFS